MRQELVTSRRFSHEPYIIEATSVKSIVTWNPSTQGGHLHVVFNSMPNGPVYVALDPAFNPVEGDLLRITTTAETLGGKIAWFGSGSTLLTTYDNFNTPVELQYKRTNTIGSFQWLRVNTVPNDLDAAATLAYALPREFKHNGYMPGGTSTLTRMSYAKRVASGGIALGSTDANGYGTLFYSEANSPQSLNVLEDAATFSVLRAAWSAGTGGSDLVTLGDASELGAPGPISIIYNTSAGTSTNVTVSGGFTRHVCPPYLGPSGIVIVAGRALGGEVTFYNSNSYGYAWGSQGTVTGPVYCVYAANGFVYYGGAGGVWRAPWDVNTWTQVLTLGDPGAPCTGLGPVPGNPAGVMASGEGQVLVSQSYGDVSTWIPGFGQQLSNILWTGTELIGISGNVLYWSRDPELLDFKRGGGGLYTSLGMPSAMPGYDGFVADASYTFDFQMGPDGAYLILPGSSYMLRDTSPLIPALLRFFPLPSLFLSKITS